MADHDPRRKIIERANRLLKQSKMLRKMSAELLTESSDIRAGANQLAKNTKAKTRQRSK